MAALVGKASRLARSALARLRPAADFLKRTAGRTANLVVEASRLARASREWIVAAFLRSKARLATFRAEVSRRARSTLETGALGDFLRRWTDRFRKVHAEVSRLASKSPEGTGALGGLLGSIALILVMAGAGAYRISLAKAAAQEAKSMASYEHPSQQPTPPVVVPPVAVPPEPEPEPAEAATAPRPKFPQMGEAFVERFDGGSLDEERWYISDGWSNGDWMENDWRRSQVSMTPDDLRITLERGPSGSKKLLAGGEVQSRQQFRYGYFEVRMRVPRGEGLIAGAFTYVGPEGGVKPHEIDIEILGKATRRVELTIHEKGQSIGKKVDLAFDAADGFYSYAFDWQPEYVRWYVEGVMIHEERGSAAGRLVRPQKFFLVQWGTRQLHQWAGAVDVSQGPWTLDVACVAYAPTYAGKTLCD